MANGAPASAGTNSHLARMMREAAEREAAQARVRQLLERTLTDPAVIRRVNGPSLPAVGWEGDTPILIVALPTGERWEVPLTEQDRKTIAADLAEGPTRENGVAI